jgi:Na+-transporting methylmalonyl-CoA/oxaloacetate decarboxylase gamma subunit
MYTTRRRHMQWRHTMILFILAVVFFILAILIYVWREQSDYDRTIEKLLELKGTVEKFETDRRSDQALWAERFDALHSACRGAHERADSVEARFEEVEKKAQAKPSRTQVVVRVLEPVPVTIQPPPIAQKKSSKKVMR